MGDWTPMNAPCEVCALKNHDKNCNGCHYCDAKSRYDKAVCTGIDDEIRPPKYDDMKWAKLIVTACSVRPVNYSIDKATSYPSCIVPYCNRDGKYNSKHPRFPGHVCPLHNHRINSRIKYGLDITDINDLNQTCRSAIRALKKKTT